MTIEAGDTVKHGPSGETWFLLGVNSKRGKVCVAGWPATVAELSDCTLALKGSGIDNDEKLYRHKEFGGGWDDE